MRRHLIVPSLRPMTSFPDWLREVSPAWRWDWDYQQLIFARLERVTANLCDRLMLALPPRHGKSELTTVRYAAWRLECDPTLQIIIGAYNQTLAERFSRRVRRIVESRLPLADDRKAANEWETTQGGGVRAAGVGSGVTGMGAHLIIIDDPVKSREEAESEAYRERCYNWYTDDIYTRLEPGGCIIEIQTRWHMLDLAGRILASDEAEQWEVLNLPALAEEGDPLNRQPGQALCPDRYDEEALARIQAVLGSYSFNALYQGRPTSPEGNLFKREWWRYYEEAPDDFDIILQSWDMAFKETKDSDYVVGQAWGHRPSNKGKYLLQQKRDRADLVKTLVMVRAMQRDNPDTDLTLVEDKANGPAVLSALQPEMPTLLAIDPQGGKEARAAAVSPQVETGQVYLPCLGYRPDGKPILEPWVEKFINELAAFPSGAHDDQVDATSQALNKLRTYDYDVADREPTEAEAAQAQHEKMLKEYGPRQPEKALTGWGKQKR